MTAEDQQAARRMNYYNTRFVESLIDLYQKVRLALHWLGQEKEIEYETEVVVADEQVFVKELLQVIRNQPTAKICRIEDVYLDPTCQDNMDNAQFIIHRYETDLSTLRQDGRYKNLDKLQTLQRRW